MRKPPRRGPIRPAPIDVDSFPNDPFPSRPHRETANGVPYDSYTVRAVSASGHWKTIGTVLIFDNDRGALYLHMWPDQKYNLFLKEEEPEP